MISPSSSSDTPAGWAAFARSAQVVLESCSPSSTVALLQVHFKQVLALTATHGQQQTEAALEAAEQRIVGALRPGDHLLRSGHGDFYVLLPRLLGMGHAQLAAQRVMRELESAIALGNLDIHLSPTIGVALASDSTEQPSSLQRRASAAVLHALRHGHSLSVAEEFTHDAMLSELREALAKNALELAFQPIVALPEQHVVGYEALARWTRERGGQVAPSVFIPLAEDAGLANELTRWTLQVALREFAPMHRLDPSLYCALNLSARAFDDAALSEQILAALAIWQLPASALVIEVTETAVLHNVGQNAVALARLTEHGIRLAVDDFGQGYSSLGYLRQLPASVLKVDQSFVCASAEPRTQALLEAITAMAHRLGMRAVAEGVESEAMLGAVLEAGCDFAQGYLFGRPAPMAHWIAKTASR